MCEHARRTGAVSRQNGNATPAPSRYSLFIAALRGEGVEPLLVFVIVPHNSAWAQPQGVLRFWPRVAAGGACVGSSPKSALGVGRGGGGDFSNAPCNRCVARAHGDFIIVGQQAAVALCQDSTLAAPGLGVISGVRADVLAQARDADDRGGPVVLAQALCFAQGRIALEPCWQPHCSRRSPLVQPLMVSRALAPT